jgi:hypothetical protein
MSKAIIDTIGRNGQLAVPRVCLRAVRETLHKLRPTRCLSNCLPQGTDRSAYVGPRKGRNTPADDLRRNFCHTNALVGTDGYPASVTIRVQSLRSGTA